MRICTEDLEVVREAVKSLPGVVKEAVIVLDGVSYDVEFDDGESDHMIIAIYEVEE